MTIKELQAAFDDVSFPGIAFKVERRPFDELKIGPVMVALLAQVADTEDPTVEVTIKRTFQVLPPVMAIDDVAPIAFREIVGFLAHEAAERFKYKAQLLFDPHVHGDPIVTVRAS